MDGLERVYGEQITFVRANIHNPKNQALMDEFGFTVTPELLLVDGNGKVLGIWDETMDPADVREVFDAALASPE